MLFVHRFPVYLNPFVFLFLATPCLALAVQPCMQWILIKRKKKKKQIATLNSMHLKLVLNYLLANLLVLNHRVHQSINPFQKAYPSFPLSLPYPSPKFTASNHPPLFRQSPPFIPVFDELFLRKTRILQLTNFFTFLERTFLTMILSRWLLNFSQKRNSIIKWCLKKMTLLCTFLQEKPMSLTKICKECLFLGNNFSE